MKLSTEQHQVVANWVREKIEHCPCPLCQCHHWEIGDLIEPYSNTAMDEFAEPGPGMVQVICTNCARVLLFDVRRIAGWTRHDTPHSTVM
jgi:hypothetical protein